MGKALDEKSTVLLDIIDYVIVGAGVTSMFLKLYDAIRNAKLRYANSDDEEDMSYLLQQFRECLLDAMRPKVKVGMDILEANYQNKMLARGEEPQSCPDEVVDLIAEFAAGPYYDLNLL